uniref:acyl carrier protein phosphodiesterase n=1 Tax=Thaumasiovibrio occultus TaxID=1891184 RepID=UPI000B36173A|nr:ACP phosphodiesterase [Thaumasiovibrio occultus]
MNYLAHLHLADSVGSHLAANLLADFVRGKPDGRFEPEIADGIYLHRFIDRTVDESDEVRQAKVLFPQPLRRFAGIALDLCWDHYLTIHWPKFHHSPLPHFLVHAKTELLGFETPPEYGFFASLQQRLWQEHWIESYQSTSGIMVALERMSLRRPRLVPLADCGAHFIQNYDKLEQLFLSLYPQMMTHVQAFSLQAQGR